MSNKVKFKEHFKATNTRRTKEYRKAKGGGLYFSKEQIARDENLIFHNYLLLKKETAELKRFIARNTEFHYLRYDKRILLMHKATIMSIALDRLYRYLVANGSRT